VHPLPGHPRESAPPGKHTNGETKGTRDAKRDEMEEREVVNEDAMDRGVCEMRQIYGDIAGRKDELRAKTKVST
jgi:hypothetical protein